MTATGAVLISSASLQYVNVPVNATKAGLPYNPTSDAVSFAFLTSIAATPQSSNWVTGSWTTLTNLNYPYVAQCLVGPGGTTQLSAGLYVIWIMITDSPEVPVLQAGQLQII